MWTWRDGLKAEYRYAGKWSAVMYVLKSCRALFEDRIMLPLGDFLRRK